MDLIILKLKDIIEKLGSYILESVIVLSFICWSIIRSELHLYVSFNFFGALWGVIIGLLMFIVGEWLTEGFLGFSIKKFNAYKFIDFVRNSSQDIRVHLGTAILEESFWRMFLQSFVFRGHFVGVVLAATVFTISHRNNLENFGHWIDFAIFSLTLGIIYYIFRDIFMVVSIHFIRNIFILFDRHI